MNPNEIAQELHKIVENINEEEFIYEFLLAYEYFQNFNYKT